MVIMILEILVGITFGNWLIVRPIRKQSAANCTEEVAKLVLMLLGEKFPPPLCNRSIF